MEIIWKELPKGATKQIPKSIVIHSMAEFLHYEDKNLHAYDFLKKIGLSTHAFVTPSGTIIKCRKDDQGAYHAKGFNENTLGIEFLVPGMHSYVNFVKTIRDPYLTEEQYEAGVEFIRSMWTRPHKIVRVFRHSDLSPRRKVDPGDGFPWLQFLKDIGVTI